MVALIAIIELILIIGIAAILVILCLLLDTIRIREKKMDYIVLLLIIIFAILLIIEIIINNIAWFNDNSLHLGLILGLPALTLITMAMILVLYDEQKYVFYHGLLGISAWILTLLNVIALFWMPSNQVVSYSGLIHFMHIIGGGGGLATGFANALFGVSGQRKLAKLTGYVTMGCWWGAFLLGLLLL
jgi:hypothetical protein